MLKERLIVLLYYGNSTMKVSKVKFFCGPDGGSRDLAINPMVELEFDHEAGWFSRFGCDWPGYSSFKEGLYANQ